MRHKCVRLWLAAAIVLAIASASAFAQGGATTSSIVGTVSDASGAVIPGAAVAVRNNATGADYSATTNEQGGFTIPSVNPGAYTVTVTLMGFKTAVVNDVRVTAGTPATVRVTLTVGGVEESVVVSVGSEIIQTQSAAVVNTIDTNQILKLPTGSRSALTFVTSLPGVNTPSSDTRQSTINGLPQSAINITIDGLSAQDNHLKTGDGFFARVSPRLDAIEEVTISSAAQDAANTGQGAIQIKFVTRSGSNDFSGSSYFYLQHYKLDANTWFNNRDLVPDPGTGKAPKNTDVLYQPGTRAGGPIVIPGVWDGTEQGFLLRELRRIPDAGPEHGESNDSSPARRAGNFPLRRRGSGARNQSVHRRGGRRTRLDARSDHRGSLPRYSQFGGYPGRSRRPDRPADPALYVSSTTATA